MGQVLKVLIGMRDFQRGSIRETYRGEGFADCATARSVPKGKRRRILSRTRLY